MNAAVPPTESVWKVALLPITPPDEVCIFPLVVPMLPVVVVKLPVVDMSPDAVEVPVDIPVIALIYSL